MISRRFCTRRRQTLHKLALLLALATPVGLAACSGTSQGDGRVQVVASTDVWGNIAAAIGGDNVDVVSFINDPAQDPHSFEADARDLLDVSKADLVIENGGGYDDFMDRLLSTATGSPVVVNAVAVSGVHPDADGDLNEHVWYDLGTATRVARAVERGLASVDPASSAAYRAHLRVFNAQIAALRKRERRLKSQVSGEPVAITEPVPLYMLAALGLVNKTPTAYSSAIEDGSDVSVAVGQSELQLFSHHRVDALVYNEQTTAQITDEAMSAARAAGIPVVPVTETLPAGDDYISWMRDNLNNLRTALIH